MRNLWIAVVATAVFAGCNAAPDGTKPWDQNHDGLITACEGLNHDSCLATPGCEAEAVYCTMVCRDDGLGGCLPCDATETCRPVPTPVPDCSALPPVLCGLVPACQVVTQELCTGVREPEPVDPTMPPQHDCLTPPACQVIQLCVNRLPPACESLPADACLSHPGCALEAVGYGCAAVCEDDGHGGCRPCEPPPDLPAPRCVTVAPPSCESVPLDRCSLTPGCYVEDQANFACAAVCEDDGDGGCKPCPTPPIAPPRCLPILPSTCEARTADTCLSTPGCELVTVDYACPAVCEDDGDGGCLPCPEPEPRCVTAGSFALDGGAAETPPSPPRP